MTTLTKKDLPEAIEDMPKENKDNFPSSCPSGVNAQWAYRNKYDESIL